MLTVNNTIYTYGGLSVDQNGYANSNAVQNTLALMDANSFQWSSGSNGLGLADHSTCYLKACDCLVTFGGTSTGNPTDVTDAVRIYDLNKKTWNVQGIQTTPGASVPGARRLHTATCLDNMMVVYGGGTNQPFDTDVWILNAASYPNMVWQRITMANQTQSPNSRMGHSAVLDEANKKIYIFGGWGLSATNDSNMYVLDYINWSWIRVPSTGYPQGTMPNTTATVPNNNPADEQSSTQSLSKGAIAGIAVGSILGLLLAAIIAFFLIRRRKKRQQQEEKQQNAMQMVGEEFSEEYKESRAKKDNPFYYNPGGFYHTNDDGDDNDEMQHYPNQQYQNNGYAVHQNLNNSRSAHRLSKAWTAGTSSPRTSYTRRSEIGDSERVMTGVLEAMTDDETVAATHGSHSPRQSY
ncbi:Rab9 effector protein with kelch motifs, partial [Choanephora cucurbitarum]